MAEGLPCLWEGLLEEGLKACLLPLESGSHKCDNTMLLIGILEKLEKLCVMREVRSNLVVKNSF